MPFSSRASHFSRVRTIVPASQFPCGTDSLPAVLRERDLALIIVLITIIVPDMTGMQFAGSAVFFYWFLAVVTFQLPSIRVISWLMHQAPRHVPVYVWMLRFLPERWRSVLLFLMWWTGVLIVLVTLGMCLSLLQIPFPSWFSVFPLQGLVFVVLLIFATLIISLPARLFRIVLWSGGLLYLAFFALVSVAALVSLFSGHRASGVVPHPAFIALPAQFSWSLFGLALLSLFGLNGPLLLDGEIKGTQRFLRGSSRYLWWGGLGSVLILLLVTLSWIVLDPTLQVTQGHLFLVVGPILGSGAVPVAWSLLFLGTFGCVLAYLFVFSRAFLLAARQGYLPGSLARLNRWGIPFRAVLTQSAVIVGAAVLLFVGAPLALQVSLPSAWLTELITGDQFALFTSLSGSLWCLLTTLMFGFALWLCWKKRDRLRKNRSQRLILPGMCLIGGLASLVCALSPLLPEWPSLFFSRNHWFPLVLIGVVCSLALAWMIGELPRSSALVRAKARSLVREKKLREELQQVYRREQDLHGQLQGAYEELNLLYQEQEQAAMIDGVTGLLNYRTFMQRLAEEIAHAQTAESSFLLVFVDLDRFKAINDTWGHLAGDTVLREVAERLREALRPCDVIGRYGGEEFTLLLVNATLADAEKQGKSLHQIIKSTPYNWQDRGGTKISLPVTASIGIAAYGMHGTQQDQLIEQADRAMYQAKLAGRDCVRVVDR